MATYVIKKDGSKEPFDAEKIKKSVRTACQDAGLDEMKTNTLVEKISSKVIETLTEQDETTTTELRDKVLAELDLFAPSVAAAWRDYELSKTR